MIKYENGRLCYYDKNGAEITDGCKIQFDDGAVKTIYLTERGHLGTDATNPRWIEMGRAVPCEFGVYPLTEEDTDGAVVIHE